MALAGKDGTRRRLSASISPTNGAAAIGMPYGLSLHCYRVRSFSWVEVAAEEEGLVLGRNTDTRRGLSLSYVKKLKSIQPFVGDDPLMDNPGCGTLLVQSVPFLSPSSAHRLKRSSALALGQSARRLP